MCSKKVSINLSVRAEPGLYQLTDAFLHHPQDERLMALEDHTQHFSFYEQIAGIREQADE